MLANPDFAPARASPRRTAPTDLCSCKECLKQDPCLCDTDCWEVLRQSPIMDASKVMMDARLQLQAVKRHQQSRFLFNLLLPMRRANKAGKKQFSLDFHIQGHRVCGHVWCEFHGTCYSDSRMKKVMAAVRRGDTEWVAGKQMDQETKRTYHIVAYYSIPM